MKRRKILSLLLAGIVATSSVVPVLGATTQEKIEAAQSEKAETESDLAATQERIQSLESQKAELEQYLQDLDSQYNTLTQNIEELTVKAGEKSEELKKVENMVNDQISKGLDVIVKNMPIEEAKKTGAQALFGEKYGDIVRVVNMGGFSIEFCGGTHVSNTAEIMAFKIISETGVAAGVRRIEALTSEGLMKYYAEIEEKLKNAAALLKTTTDNLADKIDHMIAENKSLHSEVESLKSKMAQEAAGDVMDHVTEVKGVKLLAAQLDGIDMNGLRDLGDQFKAKLGEGVVVLASGNDGKVSLMATVTDGAMKQGAHAGNLVKAIAGCVGGGGGGRPNMAQAGGKNPAGIPDALAKAAEVLGSQIG